jgi:hypothetical protein
MSKLGTIASDLAKAGTEVKDFFEKAAEKAPGIVQEVTADEQQFAALIEKFVPGSTKAINIAMKLLDDAAQVVEDAGQAAGANALNVSLDTQTINDLKTVIAAAKAA